MSMALTIIGIALVSLAAVALLTVVAVGASDHQSHNFPELT